MEHYTIKNHLTGNVLFKGSFKSFMRCIEQAVIDNTDLENADLSYKNLQCANIDTGKLSGARFHFTNLNHANISEAALSFCDFSGASLIGTCLAESDMTGSIFMNASFGATDLAGAILDQSLFSTLSALQLSFQDIKSMKNCIFKTVSGDEIQLSQPPLVLNGALRCPIAILGKTVLLGHKVVPLEVLKSNYTKKFIQSKIDKIAGFS